MNPACIPGSHGIFADGPVARVPASPVTSESSSTSLNMLPTHHGVFGGCKFESYLISFDNCFIFVILGYFYYYS